MKKTILITLFLTTITSSSIQSNNDEDYIKVPPRTIGKVIFDALYCKDLGDSIKNSIDFKRDGNLFVGFLTGFIGLSLSCLSIHHLIMESKVLLELWKKYENHETINVEWRKFPRKAIMSLLAFLSTFYGLTITYAGFNRMGNYRFDPFGKPLDFMKLIYRS